MNQDTFELIAYLVATTVGILFAIPALRAYFLSARSRILRQVVEIVYFAVKNLKRRHERETGEKMPPHIVKLHFEKLLPQELKNYGIKPTEKIMSQAKILAEAQHAKIKTLKKTELKQEDLR
ncbi:MAG: hypothetical protein Kow0090_08900 [Myxococcota bacterium]